MAAILRNTTLARSPELLTAPGPQSMGSWALIVAALIAGFGGGCSLQLGDLPLPENEDGALLAPPPLLEWNRPAEGAHYAAADDTDPNTPGLQLDVEVWVNDVENGVWLEDLTLRIHDESGALRSAKTSVRDAPGARRMAKFENVTIATPNHTGEVEVERILVASLTTDGTATEEQLEGDVIERVVRAAPDGNVASCKQLYPGHLVIHGPGDLDVIVGKDCLQVTGDLVIETSELTAVDALNNITGVDGHVIISGNTSLATVQGLANLREIGGDLVITDNATLPTEAEALALKARIGDARIFGDAIIERNGPG